ncbi:uncharacterized protein LOC106656757 [Trichogramma pretiosum]|uniref:uncharacterized protein LOC106656757 n=1 Tax=Trichogramma pretiosum TaxID=7493 RepID=UPI0006C9D959|nr:uncharacterized protein LOC106656757 [Trichogramma pretiosum]XP_014233380.1 uncharacterized protein LOC106656757 [Trichogramma pretiosum]XP_023316906.1 uncharacterized protein LOC106656757 [Trichogramma pretiosum]
MNQQRSFVAASFAAFLICQVVSAEGYVKLTHDGPVTLGGTITFKAELVNRRGEPPSGSFRYTWKDDALIQHFYQTDKTENTTSYFSVSYQSPEYHVGSYKMEVYVCKFQYLGLYCEEYTSRRVQFDVTRLLNGEVAIEQYNKTLTNEFVSSSEEAKLILDLHKGDYEYITKAATSISTYWFIDCHRVNSSNNFRLDYNFTKADTFHTIQALVEASFDPPTTTAAPTNITTTPTPMTDNSTKPVTQQTNSSVNVTTIPSTTTTTPLPSTTTIATATISSGNNTNNTVPLLGNLTHPFVCGSNINPEANKTYGYFQKQIKTRAPISNLKTEGVIYIKPWDLLSLAVSCNGSGPFQKCVKIIVGQYNVTGNETCKDPEVLKSCEFSISHYFLDAQEYTVLIIVSNEVSTRIHPVAVNISPVKPTAQLSVIVVPVSCSLVAIVVIVFGIAYYVQSKSRYTVEVADFDFAQSTTDMEYKTFTERLRDSFNNAGYTQLNNSREGQ